ncbi:MAG TPA: glucokinase [Gammaproteobacteria bacterium]|nr:glucokinase [Gammaproteobacteria bacterium]
MIIIAADIGGTSGRFVMDAGDSTEGFDNVLTAGYSSHEWPSFDAMYGQFLADHQLSDQQVDLLLLALPGVIHGQHARLTNLPWSLDSRQIYADHPVSRVAFINDFQAAAYGVSTLKPDDICVLNEADLQTDRPIVITGVGTGLGMAYRTHDSEPMVTEGGHVDFAPLDEEQSRLLEYLRGRYPEHVSYERILSGDGIVDLYRFLTGADEARQPTTKDITGQARIGQADPYSRTLRLFTRILAAFVGNLALSFQPFGGLYIAGGIPPKIKEWLKTKEFIEYYSAKGRMSDLVSGIPVILVLNEGLGLQGALAQAKKLLIIEKQTTG